MKQLIFMETKQRHEQLQKVVPAWLDQGEWVELCLIVDREEAKATKRLIRRWDETRVFVHPVKAGIGQSRIRNVCLDILDDNGGDVLFFAEDDCLPIGDMRKLVTCARKERSIGVGAWFSIYGLHTGLTEGTGARLHTRSMGQQVWAMSAALIEELGGFDPKLRSWQDDTEMVRRGIRNLDLCSAIHTSVSAKHILTAGAPGGQGANPNRHIQRQQDWKYVHRLWGDRYIAKPISGRFRTYWKNLFDDFSRKDYKSTEGAKL